MLLSFVLASVGSKTLALESAEVVIHAACADDGARITQHGDVALGPDGKIELPCYVLAREHLFQARHVLERLDNLLTVEPIVAIHPHEAPECAVEAG